MKKHIMATALALVLGTAAFTSAWAGDPVEGQQINPGDNIPKGVYNHNNAHPEPLAGMDMSGVGVPAQVGYQLPTYLDPAMRDARKALLQQFLGNSSLAPDYNEYDKYAFESKKEFETWWNGLIAGLKQASLI